MQKKPLHKKKKKKLQKRPAVTAMSMFFIIISRDFNINSVQVTNWDSSSNLFRKLAKKKFKYKVRKCVYFFNKKLESYVALLP